MRFCENCMKNALNQCLFSLNRFAARILSMRRAALNGRYFPVKLRLQKSSACKYTVV